MSNLMTLKKPIKFIPKCKFFSDVDMSWMESKSEEDNVYRIAYTDFCLGGREYTDVEASLHHTENTITTSKGTTSVWMLELHVTPKFGKFDGFEDLAIYTISPELKGYIVPCVSSKCIDCSIYKTKCCCDRIITYNYSNNRNSGREHVKSVHNGCYEADMQQIAITALYDFGDIVKRGLRYINIDSDNEVNETESDNAVNETESANKEDKVISNKKEDAPAVKPTQTIPTVKPTQTTQKKKKSNRLSHKKEFYTYDNGDGNYTIRFKYQDKFKSRRIKASSLEEASFIASEVHNLLNTVGYKSNSVEANSIVVKYTGDIHEYDELLSVADQEIKDLKEEIKRLKNEIHNKNDIIEMLTANNDSSIKRDDSIEELFEGELYYHLHKVVEQYLLTITDEIGVAQRRKDILKAFSELPYMDVRGNIKKQLLRILSVNASSSQFNDLMRSIGFECEDTGSGHKKLYPIGHPEYSYTVACTPSDSCCGNKNAVAVILNKLF